MTTAMPKSAPVIEVRDLVARYGSLEILSGVDVVVQAGEVRVILGGSGCGKSTLLKHMIGLLRPTSGTIQLLGVPLEQAQEALLESTMTRIGVLFQAGALLNSLTIHENVALPLRQNTQLPEDVIEHIVYLKLALVGLEHAATLTPKQLSGGMVKRAALARAMALDPEVLFCDEPSAGLDPITAADLDRLLLNLRDQFGMAIVVVTHELESIRTIADQVIMLSAGKVIADGALADVEQIAHPEVQAFFRRQKNSSERLRPSVLDVLNGAVPL